MFGHLKIQEETLSLLIQEYKFGEGDWKCFSFETFLPPPPPPLLFYEIVLNFHWKLCIYLSNENVISNSNSLSFYIYMTSPILDHPYLPSMAMPYQGRGISFYWKSSTGLIGSILSNNNEAVIKQGDSLAKSFCWDRNIKADKWESYTNLALLQVPMVHPACLKYLSFVSLRLYSVMVVWSSNQ